MNKEQYGRSANDVTIDRNFQQIGDEQIKEMCTLDTLRICKLSLNCNKISWVGMAELQSAKWDNLEDLSLYKNKIGNMGCKYLSMNSFKRLKFLSLSDNQIGSEGLMHLSKAQWNNIFQIVLRWNYLSASGIKELVRANWSHLNNLYLGESQLTFSDILHLLQRPIQMSFYQMDMNRFDDKGKATFKALMKQKGPHIKCFI